MKAIYIHGLDSSPNLAKIDAMEKAGFETFALHLNYRDQADAYQILKEKIISEQIEFVVGSSMGGYLAYWLGADLGLPCLLLNPAMTFDYSGKLIVPKLSEDNCPFRLVVIGAKDDVVDPTDSAAFFEKLSGKHYQRVIIANWMPHVVDNNSFNEFINWAKFSYFNQQQNLNNEIVP